MKGMEREKGNGIDEKESNASSSYNRKDRTY